MLGFGLELGMDTFVRRYEQVLETKFGLGLGLAVGLSIFDKG
jgi:hypothetical protein